MAKKPTYEELEHRIQELEKAEFEVKQAKEALLEREAENRFHSQLLKAVEQAVVATDLQGHVIYWNNFAEKLFGWPHKDALGKTTIELIATKSSVEQGENIMEELRQGKSWSGEYLCHHRNGTEIPIFVTNSPIYDENGKLIGIIGVSTDITERKQAEEALRVSEERYHQLFESMKSGVAVYNAVDDGEDFVFKDFNKAAEEIEHIKKEKILGKRVTEVFPGVKDYGVFDIFNRVWRTGQAEYFEPNIYRDDRDPGTWRETWVYKLSSGEIVAIYNDITDRKRAEKALRKSDEKFSALFHSSPVYIAFTALDDGRFLEVNDAFTQITGYERNEILGLTSTEIGLWPAHEERTKFIKIAQQDGGFHEEEVKFLRKNG